MRTYLFERDNSTIVLAYNWKEVDEMVTLYANDKKMTLFDIMGNIENSDITINDKYQIKINGWPKYLIFKDSKPYEIKILK